MSIDQGQQSNTCGPWIPDKLRKLHQSAISPERHKYTSNALYCFVKAVNIYLPFNKIFYLLSKVLVLESSASIMVGKREKYFTAALVLGLYNSLWKVSMWQNAQCK